jgi:hypothetical protein
MIGRIAFALGLDRNSAQTAIGAARHVAVITTYPKATYPRWGPRRAPGRPAHPVGSPWIRVCPDDFQVNP